MAKNLTDPTQNLTLEMEGLFKELNLWRKRKENPEEGLSGSGVNRRVKGGAVCCRRAWEGSRCVPSEHL